MNLRSKLLTTAWFLKRPKLYKQLLRLFFVKVNPSKKEDTRNEAEKWCSEKAIDTFDYLKMIDYPDLRSVDAIYQEDFEKGEQIANNIKVKMGGPGAISLLYHLAELTKATKIIETGVAYGWSSLSLLLSIKNRPLGCLISTDMPYAKMGNEGFVGCVVPENLKHQWRLIREADISGLPKALKAFDEIDLCHYDSDKSYIGRMWSYPLLWQKIRKGGYFISDDIGDNIAFKEFCNKVGITPTIIKVNNQYVGVLKKGDEKHFIKR